MAAKLQPRRRLVFPVLDRVRLSRFSLYTLKDPIEFKFDAGIVCLAGANGLGKSTFLQVVTYGLTGVVPKPGQKFVTVDDYYRDVSAFTREYFEGRLEPEDRDLATIELEMQLGDTRVILSRGFVEPEMLRSLTVIEGKEPRDYADASPEDRQKAYEALIVKKVGLSSFREFVFVQAFVLTFDERRHLLFWDPKVLETCLLVFVGVDKDQRAQGENARREWERAESRVRNLTYDIKQAKDRLQQLEDALKGKKTKKEDAKTFKEYELLAERSKLAQTDLEGYEAKIRDAKLAIADSAARSSALRHDYRAEFEERLKAKRSAHHHPVIKQALVEGKCGVCGAEGEQVVTTVKAKVEAKKCPVCGSTTHASGDDPKLLARLKELDAALGREKRLLDSKTLQISQLETDRAKRAQEAAKLQAELQEFEEDHRDVIDRSGKGGDEFERLRVIYAEQIDSISKQRDKERTLSKQKNQEYRAAQKKLEQQYLDVQAKFVPRFRDLAKLFLGVDLDIALDSGENVTLVLEVKHKKRRSDHQLSESQRFFIDIALRMAFAEFGTAGAGAPLYIDTPEGSLDLAYEAQAGQMIAKFAAEGHRVFMTANINTSQLLRSLAISSGKCGFSLQRLYQWTEMSEVQEKQERTFDRTLNEIEKIAKAAS